MTRAMLWAGLVVLAVGCGDKEDTDTAGADTGASGGGGDDATAEDVWSEISGYTSWGQLKEFSGIQAATSVHTDHVQVWLNDIALKNANAGEPLADGAIVVKETYSDAKGSDIKDISILKKIDGYSSTSGDLFFAQYETDGSINTSGTPDGCVNCHLSSDADGDGLTIDE